MGVADGGTNIGLRRGGVDALTGVATTRISVSRLAPGAGV